ncbi:MAG: IgGFc-binding protein, partial [Flavobacteriales bacterium]|nr:IgGFc-binding protein [Flavobacteriales bacterium]MCB0812886.1 IgGFc-binding protein [Flavobacteriales bacterium]
MSRSILFRILLLFMLVRSVGATAQQGVVPSMGTEFWLGFLQNYTGAQRLDIFISGQVNTSGTVTMPLVGWSQPFTVTANQTTTVTIPVALAEHTTSEVIENKSILIQTNDTVAVFAINFQSFTADGSQVFPIQSLGTEYRVQSYKGLGSFSPGYSSELLVVSTKDDTQVEITPTATTLGGRPPGVPFIVDLDSGQTYQVQADNPQDDLTGTTV